MGLFLHSISSFFFKRGGIGVLQGYGFVIHFFWYIYFFVYIFIGTSKFQTLVNHFV